MINVHHPACCGCTNTICACSVHPIRMIPIEKIWFLKLLHGSSCYILFTDFRTVFVFTLGWFFTPSVIFYDHRGNLQGDDLKCLKKHFLVAKRWFWGVECKFWGHISIEKCFRFFRLGTESAIFRVRKIAFYAFFTQFTQFYAKPRVGCQGLGT